MLVAVLQDGSLAVAKGQEIYRVRVDGCAAELIQRQCEEVTALAADGGFLVAASADAVLTALKNPDYCETAFTISLFTSTILCAAVSCAFHAVVCGTKDGFLSFCSLTTGSLVRLVDLDGRRPRALLTTPSWGFVVAYTTQIAKGKCESGLSIFTINGDLIHSCVVKHRLTAWSARKSDDGFDMIAMPDDNCRCYAFEAFFLNPIQRFMRMETQVVFVSLLDQEATAAMVFESGEILFAPANHLTE